MTPSTHRPLILLLAAAVTLSYGLLMACVPYLFDNPAFQHIASLLRPLGWALLIGGMLLAATQLFAPAPRWLDLSSRLTFALLIGYYWSQTSVRTGNATGIVVYALLILVVLADGFDHMQRFNLLDIYLKLVGGWFGLAMLFMPSLFSLFTFIELRPWLTWMGLLFLSGSGAMFFASRWPRLRMPGLLILALAWGWLAVGVGLIRGWTGATLYSLHALVCFLALRTWFVVPVATIRWRVFRSMILGGVVPLILLGVLATTIAQRALEERSQSAARQAVREAAKTMLGRVNDLGQQLRLSAHDPGLDQAIARRDRPTLQRWLESLARQDPLYELQVLDRTGVVQAAVTTSPPQIGTSVSLSDLYRAVQQGADISYSGNAFGRNGQPGVRVTVPVLSQAQEVVGYLDGTLMIPDLTAALEPLRPDAIGHFLLLDNRRQVYLVHPDQQLILKPLASANHLRAIQTPDGSVQVATNWLGRSAIVSTQQLDLPGWTLVLEQETSEAYAPISQLAMLLLLALIATTAALILLAGWVARSITRPLQALTSAAQQVHAGQPLPPLPHADQSEIDEATDAVSQMAHTLQSAVQARDRSLAEAAHDLRNMITTVRGQTELLRRRIERQDLQRARETTVTLEVQSQRMEALVQSLIEFVQPDTPLRSPVPIALVPMLERIVAEQQAVAVDRQFSFVDSEGCLYVLGEPLQLQRVFENLLNNAVKYSPPATIVQIALHTDEHYVHVAISDQGFGIRSEDLPHLFEPFYRARGTGRVSGSGLGLAICHTIVKRHNGDITVESQYGAGSTFTVSLPRLTSEQTPTPASGDTSSPLSSLPSPV